LPSPRIDQYFVVDGEALTVPVELRSQVLERPASLLTLFDLARSRRLTIDPSLLEDIHRQAETLSSEQFHTPETGRTFLSILAGPGTARTLEAMHRAHLLEKLVPAFSRVRGLMQFNQYHKYTVDEHSLLAVAKAEALAEHTGVLGEVYREIKRKDLLHLALLLHDLGKGHEEDHSEVGRRLAEETAARLGFDERDSRTLVMLVHRHLLMAHTAFRRDPYDEKVLLPFAREVGTPEVLRKLLTLTAADIAAVGPDVLTKWKESLLIELYLRAMQEVSGERETADEPQRLARIADEVVSQQGVDRELPSDKAWIRSELEQFPSAIRLRNLSPTHRRASWRHSPVASRWGGGGDGIQCPVGNLRICRDCARRSDPRVVLEDRRCHGRRRIANSGCPDRNAKGRRGRRYLPGG
jgi:[protein-PII] uridylyltransferase